MGSGLGCSDWMSAWSRLADKLCLQQSAPPGVASQDSGYTFFCSLPTAQRNGALGEMSDGCARGHLRGCTRFVRLQSAVLMSVLVTSPKRQMVTQQKKTRGKLAPTTISSLRNSSNSGCIPRTLFQPQVYIVLNDAGKSTHARQYEDRITSSPPVNDDHETKDPGLLSPPQELRRAR